jgi:hypothetical protein
MGEKCSFHKIGELGMMTVLEIRVNSVKTNFMAKK